jgi:hypothetical protein
MAATSEDQKSDRLTLRLPGRELEQLKELARQRGTEVAALAREAIRAYLNPPSPKEELERPGGESTGLDARAGRPSDRPARGNDARTDRGAE